MLNSNFGCVLKVAFLALAMSAVFTPDAPAQEPMQDVVYLEDGSVIRGTILEQTPGESLRIQTRDGSIFVYPMEEVERITREPPVEIGERKSPGTALTLAILPALISVHGVGQWYNGEIGKGFLFLGAGLVSGSMILSDPGGGESESETSTRATIGAIIWLGSAVWSSIDAYQTAQRINQERGIAIIEGGPSLTLGVDASNRGGWEAGFTFPVPSP